MTTESRLHQVLERVRSRDHPELRASFVMQVAEVEERNVFDDDRAGAQRELRQLIEIEVAALAIDEENA